MGMNFVNFVKTTMGGNYTALLKFFENEIQTLAEECGIDWAASEDSIIFDGGRSKAPDVQGLSKDDSKRVYVWARVEVFTNKTGSFEFPVLVFKSCRNSLGEAVRCFHPLKTFFNKYDEYRYDGVIPIVRESSPSADKPRPLVSNEERRRQQQAEAANSIRTDSYRFSQMAPLSHDRIFSSYLNDAGLEDVAKNFDIRVGRNHFGYFTCFALYNYLGEFGGVQRIYHKTPEGWDDNKSNTKGFNPIGHFAVFGGDLNTSEVVYICEGLKTALAMYKATGRTVVVCLMAGNIAPVSGIIAEHWPHIQRVHVADNDRGKPEFGNTGVHHCAVAVQNHGGWVFVPTPKHGNDAADVLHSQGIDELRIQIYKRRENYFNLNYAQHVGGMFNYINPTVTH